MIDYHGTDDRRAIARRILGEHSPAARERRSTQYALIDTLAEGRAIRLDYCDVMLAARFGPHRLGDGCAGGHTRTHYAYAGAAHGDR
jgi:hypothetical protein